MVQLARQMWAARRQHLERKLFSDSWTCPDTTAGEHRDNLERMTFWQDKTEYDIFRLDSKEI